MKRHKALMAFLLATVGSIASTLVLNTHGLAILFALCGGLFYFVGRRFTGGGFTLPYDPDVNPTPAIAWQFMGIGCWALSVIAIAVSCWMKFRT